MFWGNEFVMALPLNHHLMFLSLIILSAELLAGNWTRVREGKRTICLLPFFLPSVLANGRPYKAQPNQVGSA